MTADELKSKLEKHSPFYYIGHDDKYVFKNNDEIYLNDEPWNKYKISDSNGLFISTSGIMGIQQNTKIDFGDNSEQIIINYNEQNLRLWPRNTRDNSAIDGFLIFKGTNINK